MPTYRHNSPSRALPARYCAFLVGALVALLSPAVQAETRLTGQADAIRMEARDASIDEVLAALGAAYGLRFRTATPLGGRISGSFEGPLLRIVARVLDRYDYVVKRTGGIVEVAVLGTHQAVPSPAPHPPAAAWADRPVSPAAQPAARAAPDRAARRVPAGPPALLDWETRTNVANPK
jgi:hypothetical protein